MTVPTDIRSILTRRVLCHAGLLAALVLAVIAAALGWSRGFREEIGRAHV